MRGRTQAAETQHMTESWNQEDLAASSHKAPCFHAFVFHLSAVVQLIDIFLCGITVIMKTAVTITPSVAKPHTPSSQDRYLVTNEESIIVSALVIYNWEKIPDFRLQTSNVK